MKHRKKIGAAAVAAGGLTGGAILTLAPQTTPAKPAVKSSVTTKGLNAIDKAFLKGVNGANLSEIAYNPIVQKRASSKSVREFALKMVADHSKANKELVKLAASKDVKLPHKIPDEEQAVIDRLGQETGSQFDKAYQHEMIRDHTADIGEFEREISLGRDAAVKAWATKTLPVLKMHLEMAKKMTNGDMMAGM
jgi:putative membrane protein